MFEVDSIGQEKNSQTKKPTSRQNFILAIVAIVILGCPLLYCLIIPATTGQYCPDPISGHIPAKAEQIFLDKIFESATRKDYEWLATVSTDEALAQLKEIQPTITKNYKIVFVDDLSGMYERTIQFKNGTKVYLTFYGNWTACPDFSVTEQEVFENLKLTYIEKRE